ncbi:MULTISPECIES: hypothetical protein [unclassified Natrinema]|uniref:hypothetical protein n=1 Tax=unclassified Natrinema TaxID=2622230 RepID=UPI00026D4FF4|nr:MULTISPECIES: hypothetical protein [unclassified Natrinema]AFO58757.1 hypothetical protein NJ7G_3540 [Natrinema sp. J7-2]
MVLESVSQLRDRIDRVDAAVAAVGIGAAVGLDVAPSVIGSLLGIAIGSVFFEVALEEFDVDPALCWLAFGVVAVAAGLVQLREGSRWIGPAVLAAGCWICLDALSARRPDDGTPETDATDLTDDEYHLVALHSRWLLVALREADRPLTKAELCDRTGLMEADIDRLLAVHGGSSPIERVGNGYVLDEDETGVLAAVRTAVGMIWGRLVRPVRLLASHG